MSVRFIRATLVATVVAMGSLFGMPSSAEATWSVIALDTTTGRLVVSSATCVSQERLRSFPAAGLMDIQAIYVPGVGVAAAQAGVDRTRMNQTLIFSELKSGVAPGRILSQLMADPDIQRRQFGILDMQGRMAGFSGQENGQASISIQGHVPGTGIYYSIQGNILASDDVVHDAVEAFTREQGSVADRVMAAMEAADEAGGDVRCTCETPPVPEGPCNSRNAHVAYILAADSNDEVGATFNTSGRRFFVEVHDENITFEEDANPVITLRDRYDALPAELKADPVGRP